MIDILLIGVPVPYKSNYISLGVMVKVEAVAGGIILGYQVAEGVPVEVGGDSANGLALP